MPKEISPPATHRPHRATVSAEVAPESPPEPPRAARRIIIKPGHLIGLLLLFAVPVAALFGLFGVVSATAEARAGDLLLQVEYPRTARHGVTVELRVSLRHTGSSPATNAEVRIDADYLRHFSNLNPQPAPERIGEKVLVFQPPALAPDEASTIIIDCKADKTGRARGSVTAQLDDASAPVRVEFSTFTFP